ncbi:MAG: hypothetical protein Q7S04_01470 [Candidatus Moranbacteria bacterium]|nr:hypothetical protein [Candidatus Moranbacteria bacterium]
MDKELTQSGAPLLESTLFITPKKPLDEISRLIGRGLQRNGLQPRGNPRFVSTRYKLPERDHFVGYSWCYETMPTGDIAILLEISKYHEGERGREIPPRITPEEIIHHAECFKAWVSQESEISEAPTGQYRAPSLPAIQYQVGNGIFPRKNACVNNFFHLEPIPIINIYYKAEFREQSKLACESLRNQLRAFGMVGVNGQTPIMTTISYRNVLPQSNNDAADCILISPGLVGADEEAAEEARTIISQVRGHNKGLNVFDWERPDNIYKWNNLAACILYNNGSEPWRIHDLDINNSIYVGIDLGHDYGLGKSKICMTFIDKYGRELPGFRYINGDLPLNERQFHARWDQMINELITRLTAIQERFHFENVVIHKDGNILEDSAIFYRRLKEKFSSISLVEVIKSNSAHILDPAPQVGNVFDFGSFILLQTLPFVHLGVCSRPIKIKIRNSDLERRAIIESIFMLSRAFCGDSLYADKKLPITTHIADRFSSFQIGKTLQSFNIAKKG